MADEVFNFGESSTSQVTSIARAQVADPLDLLSQSILKDYLKGVLPELNRVQAISLPAGSTTFDVRASDNMSVTAAAAVSITTITSGYNGQLLTLIFNDANTTLVHDASGAKGTLNLGGSNFTSSANTTVQLLHNGTSWIINTIGILSATTGTIGGFSIGSDYIRDAANSFGLASTVTGGDDVRFWAGASFANRATAPFRVTESGAVTATSVTGAGLFSQQIFSTIFETAGRFAAGTGGTGSVSFSTTGVSLLTGANANSFETINPSATSFYDYTLRTSYFSCFAVIVTNGTDRNSFFGPGFITTDGTNITYTQKHYGFKLNRAGSVSTNSATNADGTTETATSFAVTETNSVVYTAQKNGTSNIEYYADAVLVATHSTNLPASDADTPLFVAINNANTASASTINLTNYVFCQTAH